MYPSRIFEHPYPVNFLCPICKTKADCPVVLVEIPGTEEDGIVECSQVHAECFRVVNGMRSQPSVTEANPEGSPGACAPVHPLVGQSDFNEVKP